ncbi:hypothetical protein S245_009437, partial [Arachis hypogaea]
WIGQRLSSPTRTTLDSALVEQLEIPKFDFQNPALSSLYRDPAMSKPNQTVLEA